MKNIRKSLNLALGMLFFAAAMPLFSSCSAGKGTDSKPKAGKEQELSEEQRVTLKFVFMNATKERVLGNTEKAIDLYAQCIRLDARHHASMYEIANIYADQKKYSDAVFFAAGAAQLDPTNEWYRSLLAELYMQTRLFKEGEVEYQKLFRDYPANFDYALDYAAALITNGKLQEAVKVYDEVEKRFGSSPELTMEKERLWLRLGKVDKAAAEVEKLIASDPSNIRYYSMLVDLYQSNSMPEKVMETVERMRKIDADSPFVYLALAGYYRSMNQIEKSFENLKLAFSSQELEHDVKMQIITSYMPLLQGNPEMLKQGLELSEILAKTHSDDAISLSIYGDFLSMSERCADAIPQYRKSLAMDANNLSVWQQMLICISETNDANAMLEASDSALVLFPEQSILYLFKGTALTLTKNHKEAVKALLAGSKLVVDNNYQLLQFYTRLADNYHTLKEHDKSDSYYEKALSIEPNDPLVLNNYSYYLSVRKEKLEKAEQMSKKCNEIRPGEPSYEDTYGWILYEMGKYQDAKMWLQKALDNGGSTNGTILEHMGDVLFKLGDKDGALQNWMKAKEAGEYSELLDKKIRDKQLYE
ncbi:MAG: tetratricopeptide repeat protein [Bacteroidota bacterium]